jgi:type 1 glutamine amidotransferase
MSISMNRRRMLFASGLGLMGLGASAASTARARAAAGAAPKKILFFTKSSGFQHSPITRKDDQLGHAEKILVALGKEHGFEIVPSKDGRLFNPDVIGQWDGFAFYTTGDLTQEGTDKQPPMTPEGYKAFLDAIAAGKGFVGFHSTSDSFHSSKGPDGKDVLTPFLSMLGGEFIVHGDQQESKLLNASPDFPGTRAIGESWSLTEEWYALKNFAPDLHVVLAQDTTGMKGPMYDRPNYPATWARKHGQGRVFYTSLGHREDVWEAAKFQGLAIGALLWSTGQAEADISPNLSAVTPEASTLGKGKS